MYAWSKSLAVIESKGYHREFFPSYVEMRYPEYEHAKYVNAPWLAPLGLVPLNHLTNHQRENFSMWGFESKFAYVEEKENEEQFYLADIFVRDSVSFS